MIEIICMSDTHLNHDIEVPMGDILIHCGDACNLGDIADFKLFSRWFKSHWHPHKIYVPGNHDRIVPGNLAECKRMLGSGVHMLIDEQWTHPSGLTIYGSPWVPMPREVSSAWGERPMRRWAFGTDRGSRQLEMARVAIPSCDILVTHGPAYGILDRVSEEHVGCSYLADWFDNHENPPMHIHGHIHCDTGIHVGRHMAINTACKVTKVECDDW